MQVVTEEGTNLNYKAVSMPDHSSMETKGNKNKELSMCGLLQQN